MEAKGGCRMKISEIMSTHLVTVRPDVELFQIVEVFQRTRFHHLPVVEDGKLRGLISDRDILRSASPFAGTLSERPVDAATLHRKAHQVMSRRLVLAGPDLPVSEACRKLVDNRISCLPVTAEDGALLGIVTSRDVLRWVVGLPIAGEAGNSEA